MEKAVVANLYEKKLVAYRDIVDVEISEEKRIQFLMQQTQMNDENAEDGGEDDGNAYGNPVAPQIQIGIGCITKLSRVEDRVEEDSASAQSLQLLWSYRCELTRGRNVMYMSFNKANEVGKWDNLITRIFWLLHMAQRNLKKIKTMA